MADYYTWPSQDIFNTALTQGLLTGGDYEGYYDYYQGTDNADDYETWWMMQHDEPGAEWTLPDYQQFLASTPGWDEYISGDYSGYDIDYNYWYENLYAPPEEEEVIPPPDVYDWATYGFQTEQEYNEAVAAGWNETDFPTYQEWIDSNTPGFDWAGYGFETEYDYVTAMNAGWNPTDYPYIQDWEASDVYRSWQESQLDPYTDFGAFELFYGFDPGELEPYLTDSYLRYDLDAPMHKFDYMQMRQEIIEANETPDVDPFEEAGIEGIESWADLMDLLMSTISQFNFSDIFSQYSDRYQGFIDEIDRLRTEFGGEPPDMDAYFEGIGLDDASIQAEIDALLAQIAGGPTQEDMDWAREQVAINKGFASWDEMSLEIQRLRDLSIGGRDAMQGLTDEERAQYERYNRMRIRDQERRATTQLEAVMANTGSAIQTMAAADEINQHITNEQVKYDNEINNQDIAMKWAELDRIDKQYAQLVESGEVGIMQYLGIRQQYVQSALDGYIENAGLAIERYNSQMQAAGLKGGLALEEYNANIARITSEVEAVQYLATTQLGIDQGVLDRVNQVYETTIMPQLDMLQLMIMKENMDDADIAAVFAAIGQLSASALETIDWLATLFAELEE